MVVRFINYEEFMVFSYSNSNMVFTNYITHTHAHRITLVQKVSPRGVFYTILMLDKICNLVSLSAIEK